MIVKKQEGDLDEIQGRDITEDLDLIQVVGVEVVTMIEDANEDIVAEVNPTIDIKSLVIMKSGKNIETVKLINLQ